MQNMTINESIDTELCISCCYIIDCFVLSHIDAERV